MIETLKQIEREQILNILSQDISKYKTLYVDYEHPYVERLQFNLDDGYRLFFHVIHKCKTEEALYHPHPWPSVMHILKGTYETGISYSEDEEHYKNTETGELNSIIAQNEVAKFIIDGYNPLGIAYYEMLNRKGWHYVRPIDDVCHTVMLTHTPWYKGNKATKVLQPLSEERALQIQKWFRNKYEILVGSGFIK